MPDLNEDFLFPRRPTPQRPLLGQTVLVVEDSRFASEALRLMCLRGGARIRRADSLRAAARHLETYRPSVVVVDVGLPDGSGLKLIRALASARPRVPVLLATSGDPGAAQDALEAGADGFLPKPLGSVAAFQNEILRRLPEAERPTRLRAVDSAIVAPDELALHDDLAHVADMLDVAEDRETVAYIAGFVRGLGRSVNDTALTQAAERIAAALGRGVPHAPHLATLALLVRDRMAERNVAI